MNEQFDHEHSWYLDDGVIRCNCGIIDSFVEYYDESNRVIIFCLSCHRFHESDGMNDLDVSPNSDSWFEFPVEEVNNV